LNSSFIALCFYLIIIVKTEQQMEKIDIPELSKRRLRRGLKRSSRPKKPARNLINWTHLPKSE
jgi:hypothetical protein